MAKEVIVKILKLAEELSGLLAGFKADSYNKRERRVLKCVLVKEGATSQRCAKSLIIMAVDHLVVIGTSAEIELSNRV